MKKMEDIRFIDDKKMTHATIGLGTLVMGAREMLSKENKNREKDNITEG